MHMRTYMYNANTSAEYLRGSSSHHLILWDARDPPKTHGRLSFILRRKGFIKLFHTQCVFWLANG